MTTSRVTCGVVSRAPRNRRPSQRTSSSSYSSCRDDLGLRLRNFCLTVLIIHSQLRRLSDHHSKSAVTGNQGGLFLAARLRAGPLLFMHISIRAVGVEHKCYYPRSANMAVVDNNGYPCQMPARPRLGVDLTYCPNNGDNGLGARIGRCLWATS